MKRVFINVFDNALEAMPGGGRLTLRCHADDGTVRLGVSDEGAGMPADVQARACEPFFGASTK